MRPQTTIQILRCFALGRYTARVADGWLETNGPQPLAGPLPDSVRARRGELIAFLGEWCGGEWPPTSGSPLREVEQLLGCGVGTVLDVIEAGERRRTRRRQYTGLGGCMTLLIASPRPVKSLREAVGPLELECL